MSSILDFIPAGQMKPKGPHESAGPCPLCGGATNDGFIVWPDRPRGGAFLCRKCGASGDGIAFLMQRDGLTYADACAALGIEPKRTTTSSFPARRTHARPRPARPAQVAYVPPKPEPAVLPCQKWMDNAAAFLADCQRGLDCIPAAVVEFCLRRGITLDSAAAHGLGWNASDRYVPRAAWGLPDGKDKDGNQLTKLLLPAGLIIATRRRAGVVGLTVRCLDEDRQTKGRAKYRQISGSANVPFVAGCAGLPVVLVESALDAALVWQESFGKLAGVGFMGNMKGLDSDTNDFIQAAPLLLACPDNDEGGQVAWQRWSAAYPQAILAPAVGAKDLGDMHRAALTWPINPDIPSIMEWAEAALSAIPTKMAHTSPMSHENTQPDHCATSGMKEAA